MIKFRFDNIPSRPVHLAQKYALIPAILGEEAADALFEPKETKKALIAILKLWREQVGRLRKVGWKPAQDRGWIHHVNCPPPFSYTRQRSRPCGKYLICPFCWSRRIVAETYKCVEHALYGTHRRYRADEATGKNVLVVPEMLDLVDIVEKSYTAHTVIDESANAPKETLQALVRKAVGAKRAYHDLLAGHTPGDFGMVVVEPSLELPGNWATTMRYMILADPGLVDDALPEVSPTTDVRRHKFYVSRDTLASAIGRVCRYPSGMLTGKPEEVIKILEARTGKEGNNAENKRGKTPRLSSYYGTLRNKAARERAAAQELEKKNAPESGDDDHGDDEVS